MKRLFIFLAVCMTACPMSATVPIEPENDEDKLVKEYIAYVNKHTSRYVNATFNAPKKIDVEVYTWFPDDEDYISSLKDVVCPLSDQLLDYGYVYNVTCYSVDLYDFFYEAENHGEFIELSRKRYLPLELWKGKAIRKLEFTIDSSTSDKSEEAQHNKIRSVEDCLRSLIGYWKGIEDEEFLIVSFDEREHTIEPTFQGKPADEFSKWVQENIEIQSAKLKKSKQVVYVQFTVNCEGGLSDLKIKDGTDCPFAFETLKSIQASPTWGLNLDISVFIDGLSNENTVTDVVIREKTYVLPIIFTKKKHLSDEDVEKAIVQKENIQSDSRRLKPVVVYVK